MSSNIEGLYCVWCVFAKSRHKDHYLQKIASDAIKRLLNTDGPILCHVRIDPRENVWPLVPPNSSNVQMLEKGW